MNRIITVICLLTGIAFSTSSQAGEFDGVTQLAKRRVPWLASHLVFTGIPKTDNKDAFTLSSQNGKIVIAATGPNAAAVGLNWYLKYYCHRSMSHMGDNLLPVTPIPVIKEPVTVHGVVPYRYALNYCTYNYTMSFYNWADWERELDWMALNGVNLMLVANGEEAVWQNVLRRIGYTQKEINDFITGPAYNAWWLMGNIEGWGGSMPQSQIDSRKVMVQKMIVRMQSMGIEPVLPCFFGMVPSTLKNKTKAHIIDQGNWGAFKRPDIYDPTDTGFARMAGIFYEETQKLYGKNIHFFSGDPFHEGGVTAGVDLTKAGVSIQKSMQQYFPGATWVLQGWQVNPRKEMLDGVDKSKILVQELFGEVTNNWELRHGYESTPFIWCCVNNYGERPGLFGKLQRYADETYRARTGDYAAFMQGIGIMPEGINNNPISYDLVFELAWRSEKVNTVNWINEYCLYRYGKTNEQVTNAWQLFLQTIYNSTAGYQEGPPENILCARPALEIKSVSSWGILKKNYDTALFAKGVSLFASALPQFKNSETFRIDCINFIRQALSNRADQVFAGMVSAWHAKDLAGFNKEARDFLNLHTLSNDLLNTHSWYRLGTWQQQALKAGRTPEEKKNNLHNLMMLLTYWGENNPKEDYLHEYAYKEWGSMMTSFYRKRWELYFDSLRTNLQGKPAAPINFFWWERNWVKQHEQIAAEQTYPTLETMVKRIYGQ